MTEVTTKRNRKGKRVTLRQRISIIDSYNSKMEMNSDITIRQLRKTISKELGFGERTISNVIKQYRDTKTISSPNTKRHCKNVTSKTNEFIKKDIQRKIRNFWEKRQLPSFDKILRAINGDESLPSFSRSTLHRLLKSMNFECVKRGKINALLESHDVIVGRRKYLRNIRKYREEGRPIYYLDEMWVNAGEVNTNIQIDKTVQSGQDALDQKLTTEAIKPNDKGESLLVVHIGSEDGFVPGGFMCIVSKENSKGSYGEKINGNSFRDWLQNVLPNLKDNAVIVMDNNSYHSVKLEECPTINWRKSEIVEWLVNKGEVIDTTMVIHELLDIVNRLKPLYDKYTIDELVLQHNKTVLRLPPNHYELNAIEMAWSVIKNNIISSNKESNQNDILNHLIEAVNSVTEDMWKNFIFHTKSEEDKIWNLDLVVDELLTMKDEVVNENLFAS